MSSAIISLKDVSVYQKLNLILSNVNLEIAEGEFVYLIGKVGSGKTSLLKTIYAELPLAEGEGIVAGFDLRKIKKNEISFLRRKIGMVFQDFQLLPDRNVFDNLSFVLSATGWKDKIRIKNRINEVLERVSFQYREDKFPHQLSGGEQQRVVIARALLNDPEMILADEPTGNLDPDTSEELMKLMRGISDNGRAIFMATHNYEVIRKFPGRTMRCDNGTLNPVEPGTNYFDYEKVMGLE
jgi:cell division transport system ATP-binding protein